MKTKPFFYFLVLMLVSLASPTFAQEKFMPTEPKEPMIFTQGKGYFATIKTNKGTVECKLATKEAPYSVTNFVQLARGGYYKGLSFHRYVKDFVIQGGDPTGTGTGGPGYTVVGETTNGLKHTAGALAWARTGDGVNPQRRSSGSQFYITLKDTPFLDNQYTVFGYVTKGMDVVLQLREKDTIQDVTIDERDE